MSKILNAILNHLITPVKLSVLLIFVFQFEHIQCILCVVVWAIWTVDIGLSSSVVELLTRAVGVPGSIPVQGYVFNVLYAHSYFPITFSVVGKKE